MGGGGYESELRTPWEGDPEYLNCGVRDKPHLWDPFSAPPTPAFHEGETSSAIIFPNFGVGGSTDKPQGCVTL